MTEIKKPSETQISHTIDLVVRRVQDDLKAALQKDSQLVLNESLVLNMLSKVVNDPRHRSLWDAGEGKTFTTDQITRIKTSSSLRLKLWLSGLDTLDKQFAWVHSNK